MASTGSGHWKCGEKHCLFFFGHQKEVELLCLVIATRMRWIASNGSGQWKYVEKCHLQYIWPSERGWIALLSVSCHNETKLLKISVVIQNMLKNVICIMFDHQKEAGLLCLVRATRMRLNCFSWLFSLKICWKMSHTVCLVIRKKLNCIAHS